jgi:hypothetical protein
MGRFGWQMKLADAHRIFGTPTSKTRSLGACRVRWARPGLVMFFGSCGDSGRFVRFVGDSRAWSTQLGLRVGDPASRIHALYPRATQTRETWSLIRRGSRPSLAVRTTRGHVVEIVVTRGPQLSGSIG